MKKRDMFICTMLCGAVLSTTITPSLVKGADTFDSIQNSEMPQQILPNDEETESDNQSDSGETEEINARWGIGLPHWELPDILKKDISNRIQFVTKGNVPVDGNIYTEDGKVNNEINFRKLIPNGYELVDKDLVVKFNDSKDYLYKILVKPMKKTQHINFIDSVTDQIVGSTEIQGFVREEKSLSFQMLPDGYRLPQNIKQPIIISPDKESIDYPVVHESLIIQNEVKYVDKSGFPVWGGKQYFHGQVGEQIDIRPIDLPQGYEFADDKHGFKIDKLDTPHKVVVKGKEVKLTVRFIDAETRKQVDEDKTINGKVGGYVKLTLSDISSKYEFESNELENEYEQKGLYITQDKSEYEILLRKKRITNTIVFLDNLGKTIHSFEIKGDEGDLINDKLSGHVSPDWHISNDKQYFMQSQGKTVNIFIDRLNVFKSIKFLDSQNKVISVQPTTKFKVGSTLTGIEDLIPKGYKLPKTYHSIQIKDDGAENIEIKLDPAEIKNHIKLIDNENKSDVLKEIDLVGTVGTSIKLTKGELVEGYKQVGPYLITTNDEEKIIYVSKIISNTINYYDQQGKLIVSKVVYGSLQDTIKLNTPKGYINPDNFNEYIPFKKDKTIRNIRVVPKIATGSTSVTDNSGEGTTTETNGSNKPEGSTHSSNNFTVNENSSSNSSSLPNISETNSGTNAANNVPDMNLDKNIDEKEVEDFETVVSTHMMNNSIPIFQINGKQSGRNLAINTDWVVDKKTMINGELYYRVSTNEWVKAAHVFEYTKVIQNVNTKSEGISFLYNSRGERLTAHSLTANTSWYSDRTAMINGKLHYRVSTAEWLSAEDVQ
ncbi:SLAP domain-containing protein [Companilactobacillus mishanensis]|uniref:S-layer protein C-terminal domain-containing protein n=1 Tax=Companilactobacillus mishanensis TaxID=2486008 RepID=A0ABW9P9G2_9LACO|nr:SLAP domain-containing protein [Companilactobacillus mishanensis]MQS45880.1 hypothetical protein [Companilactobacillus mishanensis]